MPRLKVNQQRGIVRGGWSLEGEGVWGLSSFLNHPGSTRDGHMQPRWGWLRRRRLRLDGLLAGGMSRLATLRASLVAPDMKKAPKGLDARGSWLEPA